ncbi:MAG: lipid-A-disaccharide synthase [Bacteroidota bacterium]
MKYYIIAGEPSGDLHGSNLMKALKKRDHNAEFAFWGGDHMLSIDRNAIMHIRETAIMGFVEVAKNLPKIKSFFKKAKETILDFAPDVIIFIDYPGFNLRMAKWARKKGFKTVFYISPQLWAWKKGRVNTIRKYIDEMIVILPFEVEFYKNYEINAHFVGHPLLPVIKEFIKNKAGFITSPDKKKILAILPGSRIQEIGKILPEMVQAACRFKDDFRICIAMAPNVERSFYKGLIADVECNIELIDSNTYGLLSKAYVALVTSGTATLETALFGVPQVVCYKTSSINYQIGKRLVDLKYISLVNLISEKEIVPELIQNDVNPDKLEAALKLVLEDITSIKNEYKLLDNALSSSDLPSDKAADVVMGVLAK